MLPQTAGNGTEGTFTPTQLFAGESDIVTTDDIVASGNVVALYTVMGKNSAGKIVPWAPHSVDDEGLIFASGTLTFTGQPVADETVAVNGHTITWKNSGAIANQCNIGTDDVATVANLAALINAAPATYLVDADIDATGLVLTLIALTAGTGGNSIALAESSTNVAKSNTTLLGGSATAVDRKAESFAYGIMAAAVDASGGDVSGPVYIGGVFNADVLVWPAGYTDSTDATVQLNRKAAFQRGDLTVKTLKF